MPRIAFTAAQVDFIIEGDDSLIDLLRVYYLHFPAPRGDRSVRIHWIGNECRWSGPADGLLRVAHDGVRASATTILVAQILAALNPSGILLHGNALVHDESNQFMILIGDSGAGKTTLCHQLMEIDAKWRLLAEDVIIVDEATRIVSPFPRAATIRGSENPNWHPLGESQGTKSLLLPESFRAEPVSMDAGMLAFLQSSSPGRPVENLEGEKIWVTWWDDALDKEFERLPVLQFARLHSLWMIEYSRKLSPEERNDEAALLAGAGSLIVHAQRTASARGPVDFARPPAPLGARLSARDGLAKAMATLHSPRGRFNSGNAGKLFISLGRALAPLSFVEFTPGGTPRQSAHCLLEFNRTLSETAP